MNYSHDWDVPPRQPELRSNDVHIWRVYLHAAATQAKELFELLSSDEVDRSFRFHFQRDRDRFILVRGVLRILLSMYIQILPEQIKFQYSARGRPSLVSEQNDVSLDFNISHSHELALLAFTLGRAVGVDLEYIRPAIVQEKIAEYFFSPQEIASLRSLPGGLQPAAFFNCWTRKEALIKATGEGLSRPLDQFSMSLVPGETARLLDIQGENEKLSIWFVQELNPSLGYAAALVTQTPVRQIYCWEYSMFQ